MVFFLIWFKISVSERIIILLVRYRQEWEILKGEWKGVEESGRKWERVGDIGRESGVWIF